MKLLSWNIQSGKGCDGITDVHRIADHIYTLGNFEIICLQEVARNMEEYCAKDQMDQVEILTQAFSHFTDVWGSGFSWPNDNKIPDCNLEFGNLTLVKSAPLDRKVHQLPMPGAPGNKQMPRIAVEAIIESAIGPLSIINTHLAYHDARERQQQLERLNLLEQERKAQHLHPKLNDSGAYQSGPLPNARIVCGDFNFAVSTPEYNYLLNNDWGDAWRSDNKTKTHLPTCGIFDHKQWPQGPHCRDFFWISEQIKHKKITMTVDTTTMLSDHQPIQLEINI